MTSKVLQDSPNLSEDPREAKKAIVQNKQPKRLLGEKELEIEILKDLLKKRKFRYHQGRNCQ